MTYVDNSRYDRDDNNYQDHQQRQVAACREFYTEADDKKLNRISILQDVFEEPLEKTRIYGPFELDVVRWVLQAGSLVRLIVDADGKECIEY